MKQDEGADGRVKALVTRLEVFKSHHDKRKMWLGCEGELYSIASEALARIASFEERAENERSVATRQRNEYRERAEKAEAELKDHTCWLEIARAHKERDATRAEASACYTRYNGQLDMALAKVEKAESDRARLREAFDEVIGRYHVWAHDLTTNWQSCDERPCKESKAALAGASERPATCQCSTTDCDGCKTCKPAKPARSGPGVAEVAEVYAGKPPAPCPGMLICGMADRNAYKYDVPGAHIHKPRCRHHCPSCKGA